MKKFLTILSILGYSLFATAQCEVSISADSTAVGIALTANTINNLAVTFEWNTGETTQTINANPDGFDYCVTATFADGCSATACFGGGGASDCDVDIITIQNGDWLQAQAFGTAPFTFSWNTGETGMAIPIVMMDTVVCVTMTDAVGCVAVACIDVISTCNVYVYEQNNPAGTSLATSVYGNAPFSYNWSNGATTADITHDAFGTYCVTITDNTGCESDYCYDYAAPMDCSVFIYQTDSTLTGEFLVAAVNGIGDFTYQWSTGETVPEIQVSMSGLYCVTVTNDVGCESTDCFDYFYNPCEAHVTTAGNSVSGYELCALSEGVAPFTYLWSTGETSACIDVNESGTYAVTITDAAGCGTEICCLTYQVLPPNNGLQGTIYTIDSINGGLNLEGWVYRIGINPDDGTASLIDSTEIFMDPSGFVAYYDFGDVDAGTYLVKAALTEGSDNYETTLPTYHFNSLTWGEADLITVPTNGWAFYNISMIPGDNPGGPGGIYGSVIVGDGFVLDPIPNTSILLFDESENPMLHTLTDANGEFGFPSLPWGTYKVQIEIIGQEPAWYWVTIGPNNPTAEGLVFEVSEFGIMTDISEILEVASFQVFPNPVSEKLTINFNAAQNAQVQISLISITGKTLLVDNQQLNVGLNTIEMNVVDIPTGIYFLNIADGREVISYKVVKK